MRIAVTLVVVVALVGCNYLGGTEKTKRRSSLAQQLAALKAGTSDALVWTDDRCNSQDLRQIQGQAGIRRLEILGGHLVTNDWWVIATLPDLEWLKITESLANDRALELLGENAHKLRILNLEQTRVTDQGLAALAGLSNLELLRLQGAGVTDAGLPVLARLPKLKAVHLIDPGMSDAGLATFQSMPQLQSLYLDGSKVSDAALSALMKARPDLHLHVNNSHLADDPNADPH